MRLENLEWCRSTLYVFSELLYHFVQFGHPLSLAEVVWTKSVPCPLSPAHVADIKMWFEKRVKNGNFSKILTLKNHSKLNRRCTLIAIYY